MADNYNSRWTGAEIDDGIEKARNAVPLDGSKAMTGPLRFAGGAAQIIGFNYGLLADALTSDLDYAKRFGLWIRPRDQADKTNALNFVDGLTNTNYPILHTGNKPSGSYTGNGSAEIRTIDTGGIGSVIAIHDGDGNSMAILTPSGGIYKNSQTEVCGLIRNNEATAWNGILTIATDNSALNSNGVTYYYYVL